MSVATVTSLTVFMMVTAPLLLGWYILSVRNSDKPPGPVNGMAAFIKTAKRLNWRTGGLHFALPLMFLFAAISVQLHGEWFAWFLWLVFGVIAERGWRDFKNGLDTDNGDGKC